jgi:hypothetical protein
MRVNALRYQQFPQTSALSQHPHLDKTRLAEMIERRSDTVYAYVMSTVVLDRGQLKHTGTGPNFQGGYITLCTCKHRMRASLSSEDWPNKWIAGFTSLDCGRRHWLFYLAKVREAFESQSELWYSGSLSHHALEEKSARYSELGDLYEPKRELGSLSRYDPNSYHTPISGHSHHVDDSDQLWRIDIDYSRKKLKVRAKRQPSLLVGDPKFSFLWRTPTLYMDGKWRHTIYEGLVDFLHDLNETRRSHHEETGRLAARRRGCGMRRHPRPAVS